jgi:hypothetical protein
MFCGRLFDDWLGDNIVKQGFNSSMLPPHGQAKYNDYAHRLGETGLCICHCCIDTVSEKISSSSAGAGASVGLNIRYQ